MQASNYTKNNLKINKEKRSLIIMFMISIFVHLLCALIVLEIRPQAKKSKIRPTAQYIVGYLVEKDIKLPTSNKLPEEKKVESSERPLPPPKIKPKVEISPKIVPTVTIKTEPKKKIPPKPKKVEKIKPAEKKEKKEPPVEVKPKPKPKVIEPKPIKLTPVEKSLKSSAKSKEKKNKILEDLKKNQLTKDDTKSSGVQNETSHLENDATDIEMGQYQLKVMAQIKANWILTNKRIIRQNPDISIEVVVHVSSSGAVNLYKITKKSGIQSFDTSCMNAIRRSSPFPEPSNEIKKRVSQAEFIFEFRAEDILKLLGPEE